MSETASGISLGEAAGIAVIAFLLAILVAGGLDNRDQRRALCPLAHATYENPEDFYREHPACRYLLDEESP